ncbi:MAG: T9SS type A sorting domain-containing protein [Flavobacteriales bacterium]|nr:T9SS type A sorting domain-containing protein [Flavobacteriales bacterium]
MGAEVPAQLPGVQWQRIKALTERPEGTLYSYITNSTPVSYNPMSVPLSTSVDPEDSGLDWFNDVCLVRDANGEHIGYAVAGYSYIPNWGFTNAHCESFSVSGDPYMPILETKERRLGMITGTVAYFDLDGNPQWHHTYMGGLFQGIIQDRNGDLVVTGYGLSIAPWPNTPWAQQPIYYNPTTGQPLVDLGDPNIPCDAQAGKMVVLKIDLTNGHVLWNHAYGSNDDPSLARNGRTYGYSLVETDPDGDGGYRVVGYRRAGSSDPALAQRPFMVDLDANGMLNWKVIMDEAYLSALWPDANWLESQAFHITRHPDPAQDKYAVTGMRWQFAAGTPIGFTAFLLYFDGSGQTPTWFEDTGVDATEYALTSNSNCSANRVQFAVDGQNTSIIWPVLTDFTSGYGAQPDHQATGRVYRMDLNGDQLWAAPADLGPMRGYDILLAARQRANGHVIISSTKSTQSTTPLQWSALSQDIQNCLTNTYTIDHDNDPNTPDQFDWPTAGLSDWGHWLSDSYMAELDLADGSVNWEGTWDADAVMGVTPLCDPDNLRQRQCSFQVVEADDGGLVVCGNTGHTWEDGYLIKFHGCESDPALYAAFHALYPYDPSNVYTLTATNTTWSSSMNVRGSIVIPAGKTLTINNGATISFADSRRVGYTNNIVVQPGGKLVVVQGATLTNIGPCGDGMWDGIMALGNTDLAQSPGNQATVELASGATIKNAFVGVLAANADINDPIGSTATQRGARVICTNAIFENNIHDVVLRPYSCGSGGGCANDFTVTKFWECDFLTTGPLNYSDKTPKVHLYVSNYPRTWVRGCVFDGSHSGLDVNYVAAWGVGIESVNTDLRIVDAYAGLPTSPRSPSFSSLQEGVLANNVPSAKMVRVHGAFFANCGHGLGIWGSNNAQVTSCEFKEPDLDMVGQGLGAPVYGSYLDATPTILFENNAFIAYGSPFANPCVGSTFKDIGPNNNRFYNNTYSGFSGNIGGLYSVGATIQGDNDGPLVTDGLHFKCNDFSYVLDDDFDLAFTGPNVSVGNVQGSNTDAQSPAGNTFLQNCTGNEEHMQVDDVPNNLGLYFQYWHHAPTTGVEVVPTCLTNPPLIPNGLGTINFPTSFSYDKPTACGTGTLMMLSGGGSFTSSEAAISAAEQTTLQAVYDDWTDGGNTDGLQDFVQNPANGSYAIRNQLMLVAPKVSSEVWTLVFERLDDMNPWHVAQALIANSPLEPEVYRLMEESALTPYYKQLVANEQSGDINMQTLMESEMAYWVGRQSQALLAHTSLAMDSASGVSVADAIALHQHYPVPGSDQQIYLLHLSSGDLANARSAMNAALAADHDSWWALQDLYLNKLEAGEEAGVLSPAEESALSAMAAGVGQGAIHASAWLAATNNERPVAQVILPSDGTKMFIGGKGASNATMPEFWGVYPNPTKGEVYVTYELPEGAEQGRLELRDVLGKLLLNQSLSGSGGIVDLSQKRLSPGTVVLMLYADDIKVAHTKLVVLR